MKHVSATKMRHVSNQEDETCLSTKRYKHVSDMSQPKETKHVSDMSQPKEMKHVSAKRDMRQSTTVHCSVVECTTVCC